LFVTSSDTTVLGIKLLVNCDVEIMSHHALALLFLKAARDISIVPTHL